MGINKKMGTTCVVEIPADVREIANNVKNQRKAAGLPKYSIQVIIEAMVDVGKRGDWQPVAETLFQKKRKEQTGRGRPKKK